MISFVIPVYNEEENIAMLYDELIDVINTNKFPYEIIFINDGSTDKTLSTIKDISRKTAMLNIFLLKKYGAIGRFSSWIYLCQR